ncbi:Hypothetical_protein [Hexamita inflata]|uniref:Hypothetical_protein n=1 Tax=Hexamita inflata TaxID=28002 RepID=A0AA86P3E6_9EUKA|nr:Hypothetical protein HINF_LOCUS17122 [Hexamita inflata]
MKIFGSKMTAFDLGEALAVAAQRWKASRKRTSVKQANPFSTKGNYSRKIDPYCREKIKVLEQHAQSNPTLTAAPPANVQLPDYDCYTLSRFCSNILIFHTNFKLLCIIEVYVRNDIQHTTP